MARQYRYGDKATWDMVGDAVVAMGRPVSTAEVRDYLVARVPDFRTNNLGPDLSVLSVNCFSRKSCRQHETSNNRHRQQVRPSCPYR